MSISMDVGRCDLDSNTTLASERALLSDTVDPLDDMVCHQSIISFW